MNKQEILRYIDDRIIEFKQMKARCSANNTKSKYETIINELRKIFDLVDTIHSKRYKLVEGKNE